MYKINLFFKYLIAIFLSIFVLSCSELEIKLSGERKLYLDDVEIEEIKYDTAKLEEDKFVVLNSKKIIVSDVTVNGFTNTEIDGGNFIIEGDVITFVNDNMSLVSVNTKNDEKVYDVELDKILNNLNPYRNFVNITKTGDIVYGASYMGVVFGYDLKKDKLLWKTNLGSFIKTKPVIIENNIYVTSANYSVFKVNIENGEKIWQFENNTNTPVYSKVTEPFYIGNNVMVVPMSQGSVAFVNTQTGRSVYEIELSVKSANNISGIVSNFVMDDNILIVRSIDGWMKAFDISTLNIVWQIYMGGITRIELEDGVLFTLNKRNLYAVDVKTGKVYWKTKLENSNNYNRTDLKEIADILIGPFSVNGKIYVMSNYGDLYLIEQQTGKIIKRVNFGGYTGKYVKQNHDEFYILSKKSILQKFE